MGYRTKKCRANDVNPSVANHLEQDIILKFGAPGILLTDNGVQYRSKLVEELCRKYGIKQWYSYAYYPEANPTERVNRVFKFMMSAYLKENQREWDRNLSQLTAALNSAVHEVTGFSPHELMYGSKLVLHGSLRSLSVETGIVPRMEESEIEPPDGVTKEMRQEVERRLRKAYEKNSKVYNLRKRPCKLRVGDKVWRRNYSQSDASRFYSAKLAPKFLGPFEVFKVLGNNGYVLKNDKGKIDGPWHVSDLKVDNT